MHKIIYLTVITLFSSAAFAENWGNLTVTSKSLGAINVYCVSGKIDQNDRNNLVMSITRQSGNSISLIEKFPNAPIIGCNIVDEKSNILFGRFEIDVSSEDKNLSVPGAGFLTCTNYFPAKNSAPSVEINVNCTPNSAAPL